MKTNKYVKECGPYKVVSYSQDGQGVRLVVYPAFPKYEAFPDNVSWAIHRIKGDGGGTSIFMAIGLASELETFLNQPYDDEAIGRWRKILDSMFGILKKKLKHDRRHKAEEVKG